MTVTLAQLRAFTELAACSSFSETARRLGVTQPAVTQSVAALARHFDLKLVDVVGNRPKLTEAGAFLAERSAVIAQRIDTLEREMAHFAQARTGLLEIGATVTIGTFVLPRLLAEFRRAHPAVATSVRIANTAAMTQAVRSHALALALVEGSVPDDLIAQPFAQDELVLVVPAAGHRLSRRRSVRPSDLRSQPFVIREPGSGTRDLGFETLRARGVEPPVSLELPTSEAIVRAVEAGLGCSILSRRAVDREVEHKRLHIVAIEGVVLQRLFRIVRAPDRTLSPAQRAFTRIALRADAGFRLNREAVHGEVPP